MLQHWSTFDLRSSTDNNGLNMKLSLIGTSDLRKFLHSAGIYHHWVTRTLIPFLVCSIPYVTQRRVKNWIRFQYPQQKREEQVSNWSFLKGSLVFPGKETEQLILALWFIVYIYLLYFNHLSWNCVVKEILLLQSECAVT